MAESSIAVTAGTGESVDTFTLAGGNKRQAVVVGDSSIGGNIAPVQQTDPTSSTQGLVVRDVNTSAIVASLAGSISVYVAATAGTINVQLKPGTIAVSLDPGHLLGAVTANAGTGTMTVVFDPGHEIGSIKGTNSSLAVFLDPGHLLGSVTANAGTGTFNVQFDPGHTLGSISTVAAVTSITNSISTYISGTAGTLGVRVGQVDGTVAVYFSPSNPSVNATFTATSLEVVPTTGSRKITDDASASQRVLIVGSQSNASLQIIGITNTVAVFFSPANPSVNATFTSTSLEVVSSTGSRKAMDDASASQRVLIVGSQTNASLTINGTVTANAGTGTLTIKTDPGYTLGKVDQGTAGSSAWLINNQTTASIFTASGSASGVSVSGNTIISPSANASFKIYAFSVQTTAQVSLSVKFTNGAGSATEFWRPLITASGVTGVQGSNLATEPGSPLFVTGTSTTLAMVLDSASLVHYSVAYTKESA